MIFAALLIIVTDTAYTVWLLSMIPEEAHGLTRTALTTAQFIFVIWPAWPLLRVGKFFLDYQHKVLPEIPSDLSSPFIEIQSAINAINGITYKNAELEKVRTERDKEQRMFFANASHEMRTPMTAMVGWLDLLAEEALGPLNDDQQEAIKTVQNSLGRLMVTVNNTIDISKIEVGKMQMDPTLFYAQDELEMLKVQFSPMVAKKCQHMDIEIAGGDIPLVYADQEKFRQVMTNLVSNAVKYTPDGGTITVTVSRCALDPNCIVFRVKDTGIGIPAADMEEGKLFSKFYQVRVKDARVGSGLGLAIVKELVNLMHGNISVQSEVGHGTTFTIMLPGESDATENQELAT